MVDEPLLPTLFNTVFPTRRTSRLGQIGLILSQGMAFLHYLFFHKFLLESMMSEPQIAPELFLNRLNISYGINYKYNDQLNHNIDRVWVVTKIKIPKYEELRFPDISFDPECKFLDPLKNRNTYTHIKSIKQLCRDSAPLINLFQYKEDYKQQLIQQLLDKDLNLVLKGKRLKNRRSTLHSRVPKSNESLAQNSSHLFRVLLHPHTLLGQRGVLQPSSLLWLA